MSADRSVFYAGFFHAPQGSGWYVVRQHPNEYPEFVLGPVDSGQLSYQAGVGLFANFSSGGASYREGVVGFQDPFDGAAPNTPTQTNGEYAVDVEARQRIEAVAREVSGVRDRTDYAVTRANYAKDLADTALQSGGLSRDEVWALAKDAAWATLKDWWNANVAYRRQELLNLLHNRAVQFAHRNSLRQLDADGRERTIREGHIAQNNPETLYIK